ncbi:hypothetical protein ACFQX7_31390 [Luedemannella flava]
MADLVGSGLRQRLRLPIVDGLAAGLRLAAPVALALAAGLSACLWAWLEVVTGLHTTGPVAYAAWLAAAVAYALGRAGAARTLVVVAATTALALPAAAPLTDLDRPPLWVTMVLAAFGVIAAAGLRAPASADERLGVGAGTPIIAVCATALVATAGLPPGPATAYYQPTLARVGLVVAVAVAVHAAIAGVRLISGRPARAWLWATVLLAVPGGWLGPFGDQVAAGVPGGAAVDVAPHFGRLAQVLLATCVVGVVIAWLVRAESPVRAGRRQAPRRATPGADRAGGGARWLTIGAALGLAATIAAFALPAYLAYATPMPLPRAGYVSATIALLVATALARTVVDARTLAPGRWARAALMVAAGAVAAACVGWLVAVYDNKWTLTGWAHPDLTANLVTTLALVPFALFALDAAPSVLRSSASARPVLERTLGLWTLLASAAWLSYTTVPHLLSWGPVLLLLVAGLLAVTLAPRRPTVN